MATSGKTSVKNNHCDGHRTTPGVKRGVVGRALVMVLLCGARPHPQFNWQSWRSAVQSLLPILAPFELALQRVGNIGNNTQLSAQRKLESFTTTYGLFRNLARSVRADRNHMLSEHGLLFIGEMNYRTWGHFMAVCEYARPFPIHIPRLCPSTYTSISQNRHRKVV